jgi:hypothetical protein
LEEWQQGLKRFIDPLPLERRVLQHLVGLGESRGVLKTLDGGSHDAPVAPLKPDTVPAALPRLDD